MRYSLANIGVWRFAHQGAHTRYELSGVRLEPDGSTVATDGRMLCYAGPLDETYTKNKKLSIPECAATGELADAGGMRTIERAAVTGYHRNRCNIFSEVAAALSEKNGNLVFYENGKGERHEVPFTKGAYAPYDSYYRQYSGKPEKAVILPAREFAKFLKFLCGVSRLWAFRVLPSKPRSADSPFGPEPPIIEANAEGELPYTGSAAFRTRAQPWAATQPIEVRLYAPQLLQVAEYFDLCSRIWAGCGNILMGWHGEFAPVTFRPAGSINGDRLLPWDGQTILAMVMPVVD